MLKIGKLQDAENEKVNVKVGILESVHFEDGKKSKVEERPELEIEIEGMINGDTFFFDFYIQKPFEEYLAMKNYEKIVLDKSLFKEDYANFNNEYESFPETKVEILKINNTLTFIINMKSFFDDYFITSEFNVPITTIENALK
jgi:hypothetical protein